MVTWNVADNSGMSNGFDPAAIHKLLGKTVDNKVNRLLFLASVRLSMRLSIYKAGYTTNRCGYRWAGSVKVAAHLFQGSHIVLITFNHIFK